MWFVLVSIAQMGIKGGIGSVGVYVITIDGSGL